MAEEWVMVSCAIFCVLMQKEKCWLGTNVCKETIFNSYFCISIVRKEGESVVIFLRDINHPYAGFLMNPFVDVTLTGIQHYVIFYISPFASNFCKVQKYVKFNIISFVYVVVSPPLPPPPGGGGNRMEEMPPPPPNFGGPPGGGFGAPPGFGNPPGFGGRPGASYGMDRYQLRYHHRPMQVTISTQNIVCCGS